MNQDVNTTKEKQWLDRYNTNLNSRARSAKAYNRAEWGSSVR